MARPAAPGPTAWTDGLGPARAWLDDPGSAPGMPRPSPAWQTRRDTQHNGPGMCRGRARTGPFENRTLREPGRSRTGSSEAYSATTDPCMSGWTSHRKKYVPAARAGTDCVFWAGPLKMSPTETFVDALESV
jgi:hypothetical protein